jgi:carboxypeptidase C (cathepsin A)
MTSVSPWWGRARLSALAALLMLSAVLAPADAQQRPPRPGQAAPAETQRADSPRTERPAAANLPKLPDEAVTEHALELPGRTLRFKATAGVIPLSDSGGALQAEVGFIAYVSDGAANRPVTFLLNGGPGAASAYLNIGAVGPWRLPLGGLTPSSTPALQPNAETWLDFSDLVFIDPPGTGYSRVIAGGDGPRRQFYSVDGDADALAVVIRKWVEKNGRQTSAKFIAGESYGGFRAPKIARKLQADQGIGLRGMVLISPVLDFGLFGQRRHSAMSWVAHLPSMAAVARDGKGPFDRAALREVERYAAGDYLLDLLKGERDASAVERMSPRVAGYTGLDPELVKRLAGRVDTATFQREFHRGRGLIGSAYDPTVTAQDPYPTSQNSRYSDPVLDGTNAPLTAAMTDLYQRLLRWRVELPYRLLDREVSSRWDWGRGRTAPETVDDLRNSLATDPNLRVLIVHGAYDLVTPYFTSQMVADQLPAFGATDRVRLAVYAGGHMFYGRDDSRRAMRDDALAMMRETIRAGEGE